jgi:prepilin-type N-terminal cleavage/methylation domain-containing protein
MKIPNQSGVERRTLSVGGAGDDAGRVAAEWGRVKIPQKDISRIEPLNRGSRRESALTLLWIRWSGLTSAATVRRPQPVRGFTMVEIAICLAIIGFALVAIIGVLPYGMATQRDNREETIINQDATVFLEAIRNGSQGLDDLTNYVYAITNNWGQFDSSGKLLVSGTDGYTYLRAYIGGTAFTDPYLTNGFRIIGLLSTPEYTDPINGTPINNLLNGGYSNHIVAYVRSISGPAVEKPPQDNQIIQADAFGYRVLCVNAPVAADMTVVTNAIGVVTNAYFRQFAANLHELRLTFFWPQQPNGKLGPGRQTFRTMVAGQVVPTVTNTQWLYFYQPQSFINVTNTP